MPWKPNKELVEEGFRDLKYVPRERAGWDAITHREILEVIDETCGPARARPKRRTFRAARPQARMPRSGGGTAG